MKAVSSLFTGILIVSANIVHYIVNGLGLAVIFVFSAVVIFFAWAFGVRLEVSKDGKPYGYLKWFKIGECLPFTLPKKLWAETMPC